jgi:uncharacterized protein (TIGR03435 family)
VDKYSSDTSPKWWFGMLALFAITAVVRTPPVAASHLFAQAPAGQAPAIELARQGPRSLPEIEAAGIQLTFDVTSVKPNRSTAEAYSRFPLGPGDAYVPGGFFSAANQPLIVYLRFAYKLSLTELPGLPAWVYDDRFDIEARAPGNPTKDQMRRMMQSLLADRFKLVTHSEKQTKPAFNLVLAKAGRTGPQLQSHSEKNGSCEGSPTPPTPGPVNAPSPPSPKSGLQLPQFPCGSIGQIPASALERGRIGGRSVTMERIAAFLTNPYTGLDRPIIDRTGLTGTFDFSLEWSLRDPKQPIDSQREDTGPTILQALEEQLGLTLKSTTATASVLVIDHIEQPSPN